MDGQAIVTVSAATVALTQLIKWSGIPDRWGPLIVLVVAALGVALWTYAQGAFARTEVFSLFAGWIAIATSAAGVYGFSRAASETLTKGSSPPGGAGSERTLRPANLPPPPPRPTQPSPSSVLKRH